MERSKRLVPLALILFMVAAVTMSRFAGRVRTVEAVGLSGSGFAFGVGATLLVMVLAGRVKA
ncbi:MAG TPA: hypothetical protein VGR00_07095 [Thermoanaerobaculia bacterium]|nr:hypothetical protein [Thermoanaerobaculia bacterium]